MSVTNPTSVSHSPLSLGLGFQYAALIIGGIVLTPAIIVRAAGESETYLTWAVFTALMVLRDYYGHASRPGRAYRARATPC